MCNSIACEIPIEILGKIFLLLCSAPIDPFHLNNTKRLKNFPWAAGLVCKHWRHAFLSTPALWISLWLSDFYCPYHCNHSCSYHDFRRHTEMVRRLAIYLERSSEHPLNVTISPHALPHNAKFMLLSQSYRWRYVCICVCKSETSAQLNEFLVPLSRKLPVLEELKIQESLLEVDPPCRAFEIAPSLKRLTFQTSGQRICWILPWSQLITLHLRLGYTSHILDARGTNVLGMLENVEELRLSASHRSSDSPEQPSYVPRLKSLRVLIVHHPFFLSLLEAPQLGELRLFVDLGTTGRENSIPVLSLIHRSACEIRHLHLSGFYEPEEVYDVIVSSPDVEHLHFFSGQAISALSSINNNAVLPNLRSLTLECRHPMPRDSKFIKELSQLLESRVWNMTQLNGSSSPATCVPLEIITLQLSHCGLNETLELSELVRKWSAVVRVMEN